MNSLDLFLHIILDEIQTYISKIDQESLMLVRDMIIDASRNHHRIHLTGIGKPSYVAGYIASLLSSTGTPSYVLDASEAIHGSSGQVMSGDIVIAISNSGNTKELTDAIKTLKNNQVLIIGVTSDMNSSLSELSDVCLYAGVMQEGDSLNKPPRASILSEMILLQALSILLQEENQLDNQMYLNWHPGGSLGKTIREEIEHN